MNRTIQYILLAVITTCPYRNLHSADTDVAVVTFIGDYNQVKCIPSELIYDEYMGEVWKANAKKDWNRMECLIREGHKPLSNTLLHAALGSSKGKGVADAILNQGNVEVNEKFMGMPPLWIAAATSKDSLVVKLLKLGADLHATEEKSGDTALHAACVYGYYNVFIELKKSGASLVEKNRKGQLPLHLAVMGGSIRILNELLKELKQEEVEVEDNEGYTPFHVACLEGNYDVAMALKRSGASLIKPNSKGQLPLHCAAMGGNIKILNELLEGLKPEEMDVEDNEGDTPFHAACLKGQYDAFMELKQRGASLVKHNLKGQLPLHCAAMEGNTRIITELLKEVSEECPIDVEDSNGTTPFHAACLKGQYDAFMELKQRGASLVKPNSKLQLPSHFAAIGGNTSIMEGLLKELKEKRHVYINMKDSAGNTPLHFAAAASVAMVELLLKKGADPCKRNKKELSPISFATCVGNEKAIYLLAEKIGGDFQMVRDVEYAQLLTPVELQLPS